MAKTKRDPLAKMPNETSLQFQSRLARIRDVARDKSEPLVSEHTEKHGLYIGEGMAKRNVNVSPFTAWRGQNALTETQQAAIHYCIRLWSTHPPMAATTGGYGERIGGSSSSFESDRMVNAYLDAKEDLRRICGGIGKNGEYRSGYIPSAYWGVFESLMRFDVAIDVVSLQQGFSQRAGPSRCLQIVCFIADIIADKERLDYQPRMMAAA
jgi:hypothetical protein